jgi:hypothetical protein
MKVLITYSSGKTHTTDGWTRGMVENMRASWAQIREGSERSTATIEIIGPDDPEPGEEQPTP